MAFEWVKITTFFKKKEIWKGKARKKFKQKL